MYGCTFAQSMKKNIVNIDTIDTDMKIQFDKELNNFTGYEAYKHKYLSFNENKKHSYDIIREFLQNNYSDV